MKTLKHVKTGLLALLALGLFAAAELAGIPHLPSVVTPAQAVVGRPLTPVSYAGVARRTARRCNGGAYNC